MLRFKTLRRLRQSGLTWREVGAAFSMRARRASELYERSQRVDIARCCSAGRCAPAPWHDCLEHLEKTADCNPREWQCSYCYCFFYEPIEAYRENRGWQLNQWQRDHSE